MKELWSCYNVKNDGNRDEDETVQISRGKTGSCRRTCGLILRTEGRQSVSNLNLGGNVIRVTVLKTILASLKEVEMVCLDAGNPSWKATFGDLNGVL